MLRRPAPWLALALLLAVPDSRAATAAATVRPELAALQRSLEDVPRLTEDRIATLLRGLARPGMQLPEASVKAFATEFVAALGGRPITDPIGVNWLAGNLDQIVNPAPGLESQVSSAISDFGSGLKRVHADPARIPILQAHLRAMVPTFLAKGPARGPAHPYRFDPTHAPPYDRSVVVEDFELADTAAFWAKWYQPQWSSGVRAAIQTEHRSEGRQGLTLAHEGAADKYTSVAKIARPFQSIRGMNALRLWVHPHAAGTTVADRGTFTLGFVDGSEEIWQMTIPDLFVDSKPFILQVRLSDYVQVLRRNNAVIDLENRDFAIWMGGTYRLSIDDIRFVHDPSIPEFDPASVP